MKHVKKLLALALAFVMLASAVGVNTAYAAGRVSLNKKKAMLMVGKTLQLKVNHAPKGKKITWSSSRKSVATVTSKGKVKAKKAGKATITAKVSGKRYTCAVTVESKTDYFVKKKALPAYAEYIRKHGGSDNVAFTFIYINGDDIPELYMTNDYSYWHLLAYCKTTNEVISCSEGNLFHVSVNGYKEKEGIVYETNPGVGYYSKIFFRLSEDGSSYEVITRADSEGNGYTDEGTWNYTIDDKPADKKEFDDFGKKYGKLKEDMPDMSDFYIASSLDETALTEYYESMKK